MKYSDRLEMAQETIDNTCGSVGWGSTVSRLAKFLTLINPRVTQYKDRFNDGHRSFTTYKQ